MSTHSQTHAHAHYPHTAAFGDSMCHAPCLNLSNNNNNNKTIAFLVETEKPTLTLCTTILIHLPHENITWTGTRTSNHLPEHQHTHTYTCAHLDVLYYLLCTTFAFRQILRVFGVIYTSDVRSQRFLLCVIHTSIILYSFAAEAWMAHAHTHTHIHNEHSFRLGKPKDWLRLRCLFSRREKKQLTHIYM